MEMKTFDIEMLVPNGRCVKPIGVWTLDERHWIDLQSVLKALNMGWNNWKMYFQGPALSDKPVVFKDDRLPDALLVKPQLLIGLLRKLDAQALLEGRWTTKNRLTGMIHAFPSAWRNARFEKVGEEKFVARKITAQTVRDLFDYFKLGEPMADVGVQFGLAAKTAQRIKNGTYKLDALAEAAWFETFGSMHRHRSPKSRDVAI